MRKDLYPSLREEALYEDEHEEREREERNGEPRGDVCHCREGLRAPCKRGADDSDEVEMLLGPGGFR